MTEPAGGLTKLREAFPDEAVDKLPRGIKKGADKRDCRVCGGYHEPAAVHLDYVGHAQVTARLLDVDPMWQWEPVSFDDAGQPALARKGDGTPFGLWIRLTVCGVTRYGFGELPAAKQADGVKEAIGDAIRNAAMRFGVALDLWAKSELASVTEAPSGGSESQAAPEPAPPPEAATERQRVALRAACTKAKLDDDGRHDLLWLATNGRVKSTRAPDLTKADIDQGIVACELLTAGHVRMSYTTEGDLQLIHGGDPEAGTGRVLVFPLDVPKVRAWAAALPPAEADAVPTDTLPPPPAADDGTLL